MGKAPLNESWRHNDPVKDRLQKSKSFSWQQRLQTWGLCLQLSWKCISKQQARGFSKSMPAALTCAGWDFPAKGHSFQGYFSQVSINLRISWPIRIKTVRLVVFFLSAGQLLNIPNLNFICSNPAKGPFQTLRRSWITALLLAWTRNGCGKFPGFLCMLCPTKSTLEQLRSNLRSRSRSNESTNRTGQVIGIWHS